jgi:glycosyltransferase involved in cell wall biosynthesis
VLPPVKHSEIIALMGQARVALGVSVSDGVPNTMLEAMMMGAFPIQSDTVSTAEWISDGQNGLLVPPEDTKAISSAIRRALEDDELVDNAARLNSDLVSRLERQKIQREVTDIYKYVYAKSRALA